MKLKFLLFVFLISFLLPVKSIFAGTILSGYKYAWSNNIGYINFENLIVNDSELSGSAWSKNNGWIKFNPTNGGVSNNNGDLSGSAWGEGTGWIDFNNVSISTTTGKFSGTATGDIIGTLTFDCPTYCDVRTDWRPAQSTSGSVARIKSSIVSSIENVFNKLGLENIIKSEEKKKVIKIKENKDNTEDNYSEILQSAPDNITKFYQSIGKAEPAIRAELDNVESFNSPITIKPTQSGLLVWDFSTEEMIKAGETKAVIIEFPKNITFSELTLKVNTKEIDNSLLQKDLNILDSIFEITAHDNNGNIVNIFSTPIKITIFIPDNLFKQKDLGIYYLLEGIKKWVKIPESEFDEKSITFFVNHLTHFAVFASPNDVLIISKNSSLLSIGELLIILLIILMLWFFKYKHKKISS